MSSDFRRLAATLKAATTARDWSQADFAGHADLSRSTVQRLWRGEPVGPSTLRAVERALEWERYSCDAVLEGGEPTPAEKPAAAPGDGAQLDEAVRERPRTALPAEIQEDLDDGTIYSFVRTRVDVGGRPMTIVTLAIVDEPASEADRELRRARAEAWLRARHGAQGLDGGASGPEGDSDTSSH